LEQQRFTLGLEIEEKDSIEIPQESEKIRDGLSEDFYKNWENSQI
jgi:hypothetical protein